MQSPGAGRPHRRFTRIIAGILLALGAALALVLVTAVAALHHLAHPWLKPRIVSRVEAATGVQLDYQTARISVLSGLRLEGLVVQTPAPFQAIAPELLRIGTLEAHWSPRDLLSEPPRVDRLVIQDMTLTLVADESGPTSLSAWTKQQAPEPLPSEPPVGASRKVAALLAAAPPFGTIDVSGVSLNHIRVRNAEVLERWALRELAATVEAKHQDGEWKLFTTAGRNGTPLPLEVSREGPAHPPAQARLELILLAEVGTEAAQARVDLDVARQTFEPRFAIRPLLHGSVSAKFEGEKQRITVELERTQLTDSAEVQAQVLLPDAAETPPVVTRALADLDLGRLLQQLPPEWRPFSLERGKVRLDAQEVTLDAVPRLGAQGRLGLDVDASSLQLARDGLRVALGGGRLSWVATPDSKEGMAAQLAFSLQGLEIKGTTPLRVSEASGELKGHQLRSDPSSPLKVAGEAALSGRVASLDTRASGYQVAAERLGFSLHAPLVGAPPYALKADMPIGALQVRTADGREVLKGPVRLKLDVSEAFPHSEEPRRSRARARLALDVGAMQASLDATKGSDDVAYTASFQTPDLVAARPFLSDPVAARLAWKHLGVRLASTGRLAALFSSSPRVEHRTELRLQRPAWDNVSARDVAFVMRSRGDAWRHKGELELQIDGLRSGEHAMGPQHQTLTLDLDRRAPSLRLGITSHAGLKLALDAALAFDRKTRALHCDVKGDLPPLGELLPLVKERMPAELDPAKLALSVALNGTLLGVVSDIAADGTLRMTPDPSRTARFEGKAVVDAAGLRWKRDARSFHLPALHWQVDSQVEGSRRTVHSQLTAERLSLGVSGRRLTFTDLSSDTTATFTDMLDAADIQLEQRFKVRSLEQRPALSYPVQDLEGSLSARREPNGVIHILDLQLSNGGTGTRLSTRGQLDLSDHRQRLALQGGLVQDLSKLTKPGELESSGRVTLDFQLASPNLVVFRTLSDVYFQDVNLRMPGSGLVIEKLDGSVPLTENLEYTEKGVRLLSDIDVNPYSMLRFADQHPLISRKGFMSVGSITTPRVSISPLAGNLSIHQNVISLSQVEMGVREGRITGQGVLAWQGEHSTLEAHVRATGVKSSRGEPFDGHAAVVISGKDRSVTGRAEILRIGNRHLLDLLDLEDPHHTDPATNRVRYALGLGYPQHVRMSFNHGFGRLRITMGGMAKLLSIDEIRGIPMGPLVDQLIQSWSTPEATP